MPRWKRWGACTLAGLTLSGILPAVACAALTAVCDTVGWWLMLPLLAAEFAIIWRAIFR